AQLRLARVVVGVLRARQVADRAVVLPGRVHAVRETRDAEGDAVADGDVQHALVLALPVGAVGHLGHALELAEHGLLGDDVDRPARRVAAAHRTLRAAVYLDALDVEPR